MAFRNNDKEQEKLKSTPSNLKSPLLPLIDEDRFLSAGGDMGRLIRSKDWSQNPLGPLREWPISLRTVVGFILETEFAAIVYWGTDLTGIFNDSYQKLLGGECEALGRSIYKVWPEVSDLIQPIAEKALAGEASFFKNVPFTLKRASHAEEAYLDFCFSPLRDETGSIAGILQIAIETTAAVLAERRQAFIVELGDRLKDSTSPETVMTEAVAALGGHLEVAQAVCALVSEDGTLTPISSSRTKSPLARIEERDPAAIKTIRSGRLIAIEDTGTDPRTDATDVRAFYNSLKARALLLAPLLKDGRTRGLFFLIHPEPRHWAEAEIALIKDVADRTGSIMERVQATLRLQKSEARLSAIFSRAAAGLCQISLNGRFQDANDELCRILGRSRKKLLTLGVPDVTHPDDLSPSLKSLQRLIKNGKPVSLDKRYVRPDGTIVFANSSLTLLKDEKGAPQAVLAVTIDLTERRGAEAAVRESEERYRTLFESIEEGFCVIEVLFDERGTPVDHRFLEVNPAFERHADLKNVRGRTARELIPDLDSSWFSIYGEVALTGRSARFENYASAMNCWFDVYAFRIGKPEDRKVGLLFDDITERKEAERALRESEQQLRELSQTLEKRVAERTTELEEQTVRLRNLAAELTSTEQRERKRLAALLHDGLQQLLVAANMQLKSLGRRLVDQPALVIEAELAADAIDEATQAARDLTQQLRPPALYEDSLGAAVKWLASEMQKLHGITVTVDEHDGVEQLNDDIKALVFECVRELLFNIVKYAGVDEATVLVRPGQDSLEVTVRDHGCGFVIGPTKEMRQAGGFGLFSIRERLAALGGDMMIDSEPGAGTEVVLKVPTLAAAKPETVNSTIGSTGKTGDGRAGQPSHSVDHRIRVVVVDDHALVRQGIANIINSDEGLVVIGEARDGVAAIEAVELQQPDVVLIDVNMPRMNGIEATREIHRRWPQVCIIGMSVQDDETTAQSMVNAGASSFLPKAGDSDHMIATIIALSRMLR